MSKTTLQTIIDTLVAVNGTKQWEFNDHITVRLNEKGYPLEISGLQASQKGELFIKVIDYIGTHPEGNWIMLNVHNKDAGKVIDAVQKRVESVYQSNVQSL